MVIRILFRLWLIGVGSRMSWRPNINALKIASINYYVDFKAENAADVLVPLDIDKYPRRRTVKEIAGVDDNEKKVDRKSVTIQKTTFKVMDYKSMYAMYDDLFGSEVDVSPEVAFKRLTKCHVDFKQFKKLNPVLRIQEKVICGMWISNILVFNSVKPVYIGDWLDKGHPFLSMGEAIYRNEKFACRMSTLCDAIVGDQERYKKVIYTAVTEYEAFEGLKNNKRGDFTELEYKFYVGMQKDKNGSDDKRLRETSVRQLFLECSPYILAKYRNKRFKDVCSTAIQSWLYKLLRLDSRVDLHVVGTKSLHKRRRVFEVKAGLNQGLFRNIMEILSISDQNIGEVNYYDYIFRVWDRMSWGRYVDGKQIISIQGFNIEFKENGDNEEAWGMARVLTKLGRSRIPYFVYVFYYVLYE